MSLKSKSPVAPPPSELGRRIRAERERLGLTQDDVARILRIGKSSYRHLEGTANPATFRLLELVQVVGMDLDALLPEILRERRS
jgi:transcriptional regulator with XRE-family HTH domain